MGKREGKEHVGGDERGADARIDAGDERERPEHFADVRAVGEEGGHAHAGHHTHDRGDAVPDLGYSVQPNQMPRARRETSLPTSSGLFFIAMLPVEAKL